MTKLRTAALGAVLFGLVGCSTASDAPANLRIFSTEPGQRLSGPSSAVPAQVLADYLGRSTTGLKVEQTNTTSGVTHVRVGQEIGGVRVVGAYARAAVLPTGELVHVIDALVPEQTVTAATLPAADALTIALNHFGYDVVALTERSVVGNVTTFEPTHELFSAPTVERVIYTDVLGKLQSGFEVETWTKKGNQLHHTLIAADGSVVSVENRTNKDSYNVFIEDPLKGGPVVVQGPGAGNVASPSGWLSGTQLSTAINGNNVNAYLDADGNNRTDRGGVSITNGNFVSPFDLTQSPSTTGNKAAAVQNLFYLNNRVHDILYGYGFNEAAGNFQVNNFGKGGSGNDPVQAEAQDGSGTDNANFATPADGQKPRMQMYLWSGTGPTHEVLANGTVYAARGAEFGSTFSTSGVTGALAIANDGVGDTADGCEAFSGVSGKVVLVMRGTCAFTVKVQNAAAAGATAVIVGNNTGGDETFVMGGTVQGKLRIGAVMVSQNTAALLVAGSTVTARLKAQQPLMIDGDIDSDIVFHEYGHGLSWRMIGGMSGKLAGAIGEGASDTVAFLINGGDIVGEYAYGNVNGIRRYRYAGYPLTYKDVTGEEVHNDGEIYAAAMWRLRELVVANNLSTDTLFRLFVDGMNYTPSTPSYEKMRDGMLQAASVQGQSAYTCLIWQAFAEQGIGQGASGTATTSGVTIVESFAMPSSCP
jgi:hypothetical protein